MNSQTVPRLHLDLLSRCILLFLAGILIGHFFLFHPFSLALTATLAAGFALLAHYLRKISAAKTCMYLICLLYGAYLNATASKAHDQVDHIYTLIQEKQESVLVGAIAEMPLWDGQTSQIILDLRAASPDIDGRLQHIQGKVLLRVNEPLPQTYSPGKVVAVRAFLERPRNATTPGVFNFAAHLARQGIWVTGYFRSAGLLTEIKTVPASAWHWFHRLFYLPESLRHSIGLFLDAHLIPEQSALFRAVLIGDTSRLSQERLEIFKASGTFHILAISGSHIAVLSIFCFSLTFWLFRRSEYLLLHTSARKLAWLSCLPLVFAYALIAGGNSPVIRSVLMCSIAVLAFCTDRPKSLLPLILFAALLMLIPHPQELFTASFQLSFAAVGGILMMSQIVRQWPILHKNRLDQPNRLFTTCRKWIVLSFLVSLAASLSTAPLILFYFNRFPIYGIPATLLVEPIISLWALLSGILALPFISIWPDAAETLFRLGALGLDLAEHIARFFAHLPQSTLWFATPSPFFCLFYAAVLVLFFRQMLLRRYQMYAGFLLLLAMLGLILPSQQLFNTDSGNRVTYLDVGQGSATLLESADGRKILIDGGGSSLSRESVGSRIIAPYLWARGITRLDLVINTHPDADHFNGLPFILEHFSPKSLWVSTDTIASKEYAAFLDLAKRQSVQLFVPETGFSTTLGDLQVTCLYNPFHGVPQHEHNAGLVIKVMSGNFSALFPGDIEQATEQHLVETQQPLIANILLAAHHGSRTSNSPALLKAVDPQLVIVSAGANERGLFPGKDIIQYCQENKIPLLTTREQGSMQIKFSKSGLDGVRFGDPKANPLRRQSGTQTLEQWKINDKESDVGAKPP